MQQKIFPAERNLFTFTNKSTRAGSVHGVSHNDTYGDAVPSIY